MYHISVKNKFLIDGNIENVKVKDWFYGCGAERRKFSIEEWNWAKMNYLHGCPKRLLSQLQDSDIIEYQCTFICNKENAQMYIDIFVENVH